jgi:hypothetical protein
MARLRRCGGRPWRSSWLRHRPFEVGDDLADAEHQAQVGGGRLALGDDVGAVVVDGFFELIDLAVGVDDGA